ncbi:MAG TPA: T9SS type A sorting domain-containing protein [Saprospiraceae bacterium]|jgi:hypothetical protein|nr:T9SS type A sorting domain-containing protein [Saprospiraceae bacterium]HMT70907.1 T9SS type A sorting domain-containing protein [Saprospiraceae bacterium]
MKTTFTTIILIISFNLISQKLLVKPPVVPFEPIKFANLNPDWILHIYDSTYVRSDTFDGRNSYNFMETYGEPIHQDKLYRCHAIREYDWMGFKVSCVDTNTGSLIWSRNFDTTGYKRQLLPMYQTFNQNNNLIIIGFRKRLPYDLKENAWNITSANCELFRLEIDGGNGNVISFQCLNNNGTYKFDAISGSDKWSMFGVDSDNNIEFMFENYIYTSPIHTMAQKGYIDSLGHVVITDSLVYSPNDWGISRTKYAKRNGRYYCIESDLNAVPIKHYFVEMDAELNELNRVDVTHFDIKPYAKDLMSYTDDHMLFIQAFPSAGGYNLRYFKCDYSGQLISVKTTKDDFFSKYYDASVIDETKVDKNLMLTIPRTKGNPTTKEIFRDVDVLHYDGHKYENYKTIKVDSDNQDFTPWRIVYLNDEYVIIDMYVGYLYYTNDTIPELMRSIGNTTMALMKVSRKELGLEPSATQDATELAYTHCYPNPSSGAFYLDMDELEGKKDIRIFDISGRNVYVEANVVRSDISLDLSDLPSGQYVYQVYIGSKVHAEGVWVKL